MTGELSVSIVLYRSDARLLAATLSSLATAAQRLAEAGRGADLRLFMIDNEASAARSPRPGHADAASGCEDARIRPGAPIEVVEIAGHGNVGYGRGHNLALGAPEGLGRYHLVLNPDVELAADALVEALGFMDAHPECGLLSPVATDGAGRPQSLVRRHPSVLVLLARGFGPAWLRRRLQARLDAYEMCELPADQVAWNPPIVSGCFMLFRSELFRRLGGFDPRFFLYFEDYDLSLRAGGLASIVRVPAVRIVHHGGGAARKGARHLRLFATSMLRFFGKHGWRWL